jgi:hypothetical protein
MFLFSPSILPLNKKVEIDIRAQDLNNLQWLLFTLIMRRA